MPTLDTKPTPSPTPRPTLRFFRPSEWPAVKAVFSTAFGGPEEAHLLDRLRGDGDLAFAICAETPSAGLDVEMPVDEPFTAALAFCDLPILGPRPIRAVGLIGPAVLPAFRNRGLGSDLVRAGIAQCRKKGFEAICVLGDPTYFARFGFETSAARAIEAPYAGPYYMALALHDGLGQIAGEARYPRAFDALNAQS
ncbi:MAG: N-acetyltransferase [Pseudomonadota bacterium]